MGRVPCATAYFGENDGLAAGVNFLCGNIMVFVIFSALNGRGLNAKL
jgi:hypothetical protein